MAEPLRGQKCGRSLEQEAKLDKNKNRSRITRTTIHHNFPTHEEDATAKQPKLLEKEAYKLVMACRYFLDDSNIVGLSVGLKEIEGKETNRQALIFDVVKKLKLGNISEERLIPKKVTAKTSESGSWEIETNVVETGQLDFHRAEGGSAICAEDSSDNPILGPCTLGAILPNITYGNATEQPISGKKQLQLITSAHLIDYEEQHITKQLRYLERDRYVTIERRQADEEFLHLNQALLPVTGFEHVEKYRNGDGESAENAVCNQMDILWANVTDPEKVSETVVGKPHCGTRKAEPSESFTLTGITSGTHWNGRVSLPATIGPIGGEDSQGEFRTYWKNMIRYKLPTRPGDSGAALLSSTNKIIGLHTIGSESGAIGYTFRLCIED